MGRGGPHPGLEPPCPPGGPPPTPPWSCTSPAQSEEPGAQARAPLLGVGCSLAPRETPVTSWLHWPSAPHGQGPVESLESSPGRGLEPPGSLQESLVKGVAGRLCPSQAPEPQLPVLACGGHWARGARATGRPGLPGEGPGGRWRRMGPSWDLPVSRLGIPGPCPLFSGSPPRAEKP